MVSIKARKQRYRQFNAPVHRKRKMTASHVDPKLRERRTGIPRAIPVRKGDRVRIMRGGLSGREGEVVSVDSGDGTVVIEGVTIEKRDQSKVPRPIHASNVMIVKIVEGDAWRKRKLSG